MNTIPYKNGHMGLNTSKEMSLAQDFILSPQLGKKSRRTDLSSASVFSVRTDSSLMVVKREPCLDLICSLNLCSNSAMSEVLTLSR